MQGGRVEVPCRQGKVTPVVTPARVSGLGSPEPAGIDGIELGIKLKVFWIQGIGLDRAYLTRPVLPNRSSAAVICDTLAGCAARYSTSRP